MINGDYILVVAPENYPYKKYRDRYCYEHILNYWLEYGEIPERNQIHHKDENKHNNNPNNLESLSAYDHKYIHAKTGVTMVILKCPSCGVIFERKKGNTHLTKSKKVFILLAVENVLVTFLGNQRKKKSLEYLKMLF